MTQVWLVCGSRRYTDRAAMTSALETLPDESLVVHGGQRGADQLAGHIAKDLGHAVAPVTADWHRHGHTAGRRRNRAMALLAPALTGAHAFPLDDSVGTWHMVSLLKAAGVPVHVHQP